MRLRRFMVGLVFGLLLVACGRNQAQSPTAAISNATTTPIEQVIEVTVTYLDDAELDDFFELASAKKPIGKGEMLILASTTLSFAFEVVHFERGEQALATIAALDPAYAGSPAGYEVGLVRAKISHHNSEVASVSFDGEQVVLLVFSKGEYHAVKAMQGLPCCFEPRFDTVVAQGAELEIYFPILVALDEPNPLLVINRDQSDNPDAEHFALQ
ncbi:hypothetical protein [Herpetosiphon geysericola]|uniref:DUF4352 domain-containing protein n=1 Tax=Herpetosiphon geysericola TaxID=70996 RepID=A0A0P6Y600_9CHLR|nr:hypothetical protein [Herpetosiphon geysericola]KPL88150.1 hypothetical protein SE18_10575 [Herpetosiphon geysericola]